MVRLLEDYRGEATGGHLVARGDETDRFTAEKETWLIKHGKAERIAAPEPAPASESLATRTKVPPKRSRKTTKKT